ncbi:MAG: hypothetical protein R2730_05890 [Chitinophagales bacterium]
MRKTNSESTPLSVWITLVGLVLIIALFFFVMGEKIRMSIIAKEIKEMTATTNCPDQKNIVFAFGSSMFRTGIANRFDAPKWISDSSGYCLERTGYLNLTLAGVIRNEQVIKAIAASKADLILIESPLLLYQSRTENKFEEGRPRQTIRMLKQHLMTKDRLAMDDYPKPFYHDQLSALTEQEEADKALLNRKLRSDKEISTFLKQLKQAVPNSNIIVVDVPRPATIEDALNQRDTQQLIELKRTITALECAYWEFDQPMDKAFFFDAVHLNKAGQEIYMHWLTQQIEKETKL